MSVIKDPPKIKFFMAAYGGDPGLTTETILSLARGFQEGALGEPDIISEDFPISGTDYYTPEMGKNLLKRYLSFPNHLPPDFLVDLKLFAMDLEMKASLGGKRRVNLDPGYIFSGGLVLSTGKFSGHRLYLGKGVWGELTLLYWNHSLEKLPWTYRDYLYPEVLEIILKMRKRYFFMEKTMRKENPNL